MLRPVSLRSRVGACGYSTIGGWIFGRLVGPLPSLGLEGVEALADAPAVVAAVLDPMDHLPEVLADVAGPELTGLAVEAELPDVPQADAVDLGRPVGVNAFDRRAGLSAGIP